MAVGDPPYFSPYQAQLPPHAYPPQVYTASTPESRAEAMRDYFAAAALTGILANNYASHIGWNTDLAYKHADAMMKARTT